MEKISFIIVNYNSGFFLKECIESILDKVQCDYYEIIVVDNGSTDDSIERVMKLESSRVRIILNQSNDGFSKANNIGASEASGDILFFLNPDTRLLDDACRIIADVYSGNIYTVKTVDRNNNIYKNIFCIPTLKNYIRALIMKGQCAIWAQGSAIIMTRETFYAIGGWPEDYFMYCEDLDLCYTALVKKNIIVRVLPFKVMHVGGGVTSMIWSDLERAVMIEMSYLKFSKKHNLLIDYHILHIFNFIRGVFKRPVYAFNNFYAYIKVNAGRLRGKR